MHLGGERVGMGARSQPEPTDDVVAETSPRGFHAGLEAASATELS